MGTDTVGKHPLDRDRPHSRAAAPASGSTQLALPGVLGAIEPAPDRPRVCCGLDEVGRGALAGPLVAAAAILPPDFHMWLGRLAPYLRDSKTVPQARREEVAALIHAHALAVELVVIAVDEINARGIGWANREAFRRLIERLPADEYVVDGRIRPLVSRRRAGRVRCLVRADAQVPAVSAAALVAKVHRDALMRALHEHHPRYGWNTNVGYGTAAHLAALRDHGPCAEHRTLFVRTALGQTAPERSSGRRGARRSVATLTFPEEIR